MFEDVEIGNGAVRQDTVFLIFRDGLMLLTNIPHAAAWAQLDAHFNLSRIDKLPVEWIPDAIAFVEGKISEVQQKALPGVYAPVPIVVTRLALESINERIDDLRVRTNAERQEILHDLMTCAKNMPGMSAIAFELRCPAAMMLEEIIGSGSDASFKYGNPCDFIRRICNAIPNVAMIEGGRA